MTGAHLFTGVDRALFAATFANRLRRSGVDVAFSSVERCAASLDAIGPLTLADAYWALRLSLVTRHEQLPLFDEVFAAVFDVVTDIEMGWIRERSGRDRPVPTGDDDDVLVRLPRLIDDADATTAALPWATLPPAADQADDEDDGSDDALAVPELSPSSVQVDMDRPFDRLDEAELDRLGALLEASVTEWPQRRSRRRRPTHSGGQIALRRTMRTAMRTGGEVMSLAHERRQRRPRPVVVLLDVSGSMERHARAYLHLVRPLALVHRAEVFAFATRLTRITPAVRSRACTDVIEHMNEAVGDRFSGTRVATSVQTLLHHRTWGTSLRGAVVLICSDGWDTDDPVELDRAMRRMSLLAHRIVWVNPRAAAAGFEPQAGGMAAALPYCDAFLAGNTGRSMHDVIHALSESA
ncbi:vWA domain-containing protein [Ilumatobacter sp.]|uniref:vWA domain-containing protein n=1 Tax=Ilumatobacter sp. TaxID=1967498 RepID=UPI003C41F9D4